MHSLAIERNTVIAKTSQFSLRACHRTVRMNSGFPVGAAAEDTALSAAGSAQGHFKHTPVDLLHKTALFFLAVEHSLRFPSVWGSVLTHSLTLSIHVQESKAWTTDVVLSAKQGRCMKSQ